MADPITPTTPIPNFTLNLEPNKDIPVAQSAPESVVKENDDRLQKEDKLVEEQTQSEETPVVEVPVIEEKPIEEPKVEAIPEVKIEETPIVEEQTQPEETPVVEVPVIEEKTIEEPKTEAIPEVKIEETPVVEVPVVEEKPIEEPKVEVIPEVKIEETPTEAIPEVKIEETPVVKTPVVEEKPIEEPKTEAIPEVKIEETPAVETPAPSALQKDLQIIQNIQQTQKPVTPVVPTVTPVQMPVTPTVNSFNLDNITTQIPAAPQIPGISSPMGNIPTAPQIPINPYDNLTNYIPQIAPNTQIPTGPISAIKKSSKTGTEIGIGVGVGFIVLAWFVIKTMYPIQYKDAMGGMFGGNEEDIVSTNISTSLTGSEMTGDNILSGELASGDILFGSGESSLDELTGSHNVATDTGSIVDTGSTSMTPEEFKTQMESYSSQGKIATLKAKKTNDKALISNSLAIYKKAEAVLQDIANGKEITTDDMNVIITELSGYLDTLKPSSDATPSTTEKPVNTGSSDFNPDAFFGANGNSQN